MKKHIIFFNTPLKWPPAESIGSTHVPLKLTHMPLGLCCLSAELKKQGFEVSVIDLWAFPLTKAKIYEELKRTDILFFGLNVASPTVPAAFILARFLKNYWPTTPVVAGGAHASALPLSLLKAESPFDYVVVGAGEKPITCLAEEIAQGNLNAVILGVLSKRSSTYSASATETPPIHDLEKPDLSVLNIESYFAERKEIPLFSSRGCEFQCGYCAVFKIFGKKRQLKTTEQILREIKEYRDQYDCSQFKFVNENVIGSDRNSFIELVQGLGSLRRPVRWRCQLRIDTLTPDDVMIMRDSGCSAVLFGIDTVSEYACSLSGRKIDLGLASECVKDLIRNGVETQAVLIIGFPGESPRDVSETIAYAVHLKKLGVQEITFFPLMLFPGTRLWQSFGPHMLFGSLPISTELLSMQIEEETYFQKYALIPEPINQEDDERIAKIMSELIFAYRAVDCLWDVTADLVLDNIRNHQQEIQEFRRIIRKICDNAYAEISIKR